MLYFCPGYEFLTWWRLRQIEKYDTSSFQNGKSCCVHVKFYILPVKTGFTHKIKTMAAGEQTIWFSAYLTSKYFSLVILIWRALFQNVLFPKMRLKCQSKVGFWKRVLHMCVYTSIFTYLWRPLLQNTIFEIGIDIWNPLFGMALNAFHKRALRFFLIIFKCEYYSLRIVYFLPMT